MNEDKISSHELEVHKTKNIVDKHKKMDILRSYGNSDKPRR